MDSSKSSNLSNSKDDLNVIQEFLTTVDDNIREKFNKILNSYQIHQIELEIQNEELRNVQIELEALKNEYVQLYNNAPVGYLVLDSNAIIRKGNVRFQNYLNLTAEEIINKPLNNFISDKDRSDFLSVYDSFFNNPQNKRFDYDFITASGNLFSGRLIGTKLSNSFLDPNVADRILVIISDVSVQKLYEKKMEEMVASKSKFISSIAHDLRNPLNSMLGYSQFLVDEYDYITREELKKYLADFNSSGKKLYGYIDNLLELSKIEYNSEVKNLVLLDQNRILGEIIKNATDLASTKNIDISFDAKGDLFCLCDKFMISTVYRNLITNAVKFTDQGGKISITTYSDNSKGVVKIKDNGIGIPQEELKNIFNLKKNIRSGTKNEKGSGIGLLITKEYLDKMSGEIFVESKTNIGTEFTINLLTH